MRDATRCRSRAGKRVGRGTRPDRRQRRSHSAADLRPSRLNAGGRIRPRRIRVMEMFDVQGIEIRAPRDAVFELVSRPQNLSRWAHAFELADDATARLRTPQGTLTIGLRTSTNADAGTV